MVNESSTPATLGQLIAELRRAAAVLETHGRQLPTSLAAQVSEAPTSNRRLVYVHGICRHDAGYSDPWWDALHPFTDAFGAGDRDGTRQEVLWSDLVNDSSMAAFAANRTEGPQAEWSARVRGVLEERSAALAGERGPSVLVPDLTANLLSRNLGALDLAGTQNLTIPGLNCVDDFTVYMFNDSIRAQIIARFTDVVQPARTASAGVSGAPPPWFASMNRAFTCCRVWSKPMGQKGIPRLSTRN